jgi:hypothetical protein
LKGNTNTFSGKTDKNKNTKAKITKIPKSLIFLSFFFAVLFYSNSSNLTTANPLCFPQQPQKTTMISTFKLGLSGLGGFRLDR